jgi:hypothetical protein
MVMSSAVLSFARKTAAVVATSMLAAAPAFAQDKPANVTAAKETPANDSPGKGSPGKGVKDAKDAKDKDDESRRPRLSIRAQPNVATSPARVVLTAELVGGPNDYEEFYCPAVEWIWGDGTRSESQFDCDPYLAGKSEIRRFFTIQHIFRAGAHHVTFRLKRREKELEAASTDLRIQPSLSESGDLGDGGIQFPGGRRGRGP